MSPKGAGNRPPPDPPVPRYRPVPAYPQMVPDAVFRLRCTGLARCELPDGFLTAPNGQWPVWHRTGHCPFC